MSFPPLAASLANRSLQPDFANELFDFLQILRTEDRDATMIDRPGCGEAVRKLYKAARFTSALGSHLGSFAKPGCLLAFMFKNHQTRFTLLGVDGFDASATGHLEDMTRDNPTVTEQSSRGHQRPLENLRCFVVVNESVLISREH